MNIAHLLLGSAREFRDLPALARGAARPSQLPRPVAQGLGDEHASHRTLRPQARRSRGLRHDQLRGIDRGHVCRSGTPGLCAVPMNAKLHAKEFAFILENSGAKLCFVTPDLADTIAEAAKEAPELKEIVDVTTRSYSFMEVGDPSRHGRGRADRSGLAVLHLGTTGRPKGATLTPSQSAGDDAELLRRCRPPAAPAARSCMLRRSAMARGCGISPCWRAAPCRSFPRAASTRCPRRSS